MTNNLQPHNVIKYVIRNAFGVDYLQNILTHNEG